MLWRQLERLLEDSACPPDLGPIERFERRPSLDKRSVWRKESVESCIAFARRCARHRHAEAVSAPRDRVDVGGPARVGAKQPAQAGDRLLDAVVSNGHVLPAGLQ